MPQKHQYLRSNKLTTYLKKPGWISCTVIPHCLSSKRSTLAIAVAACLDMQYTPLPGYVTWPKLQQVRQHENIRYYKTTAFIYKFTVRGAKSGWIVIVRNWHNLQILKNANREGKKYYGRNIKSEVTKLNTRFSAPWQYFFLRLSFKIYHLNAIS